MPELDREDVAGMVRACRPDWTLQSFERSEFGTDFVAFVGCEGERSEPSDAGGGTASREADRREDSNRASGSDSEGERSEPSTASGSAASERHASREAVLKATTADWMDPEIAAAEPRLFELVGRETTIPVPDVYGSVDEHDVYPAPFYLVERLPGENVEGRPESLPDAARERIVRDAGANLAELHELGTLPRVGTVGVTDGDLAVLDGEHGPADGTREWLRAGVQETLDALPDGGYFPDLADEPDRFADLVEPLRATLDDRIDALPEPDPPRYCHWDYRYGNLLVDPETGETHAVLDWANLSATDPAYNLACVESHLFDPQRDGEQRATQLRERFRDAYAAGRPAWAFTPAVEQRIETYLLAKRVDAMACLPLWEEDATPAAKAEREREHRAFVDRYL